MTLTVSELSVEIAGRILLDKISFKVEPGEIFGLIGESGSGKSLTALAVLGLLPDSAKISGSVKLNETELVGKSDLQLTKIRGRELGMIFQEPRTALNPIQRVGKQIAESFLIHNLGDKAEAKAKALSLAERVLLPDPEQLLKLYPHQISGGQRQRVAIAAAMSADPKLLIADEPTTALDVTVQAEILNLFQEIVAETGSSLIFITHDLAVLSQIASRAAVLADGKVVETGAVSQLLSAPKHPVTIELLAAAKATSWNGTVK